MGQEAQVDTPKRVLVADDEHLMATGLATSLRGLGFEVIGPETDGESAIEAAKVQAPDLALLDIRMPGLDGLSTANTLWNELMIPSIIISAFSDGSYVNRAQETGVFGYLLKPVSSESLRAAICIGWARAREHGVQHKRIDQLEHSLTHRRTVEQAKWALVQKLGLTEPDAHARMQRIARTRRQRLIDVAEEVLAGDADLLRSLHEGA